MSLDGDVADGERVIAHELRVPDELVGGRDRLHPLRDEADEAIPLASHARHHGLAVDADVATQSERVESLDRMRRLGRCDQQLAGHAADASARRAVYAAF